MYAQGDVDPPVAVRAALFDLDGTLIDSEPRSRALWRRLFTSHGIECGEDMLDGFSGRRSREVIEEHLARFGRHATADQVREELTALNGEPDLPPVRLVPGAERLLERLRRDEVALAVVTSGGRRYADDHLTRCGIAGHFTTVVSAEDVTHGKPDPEGYLLACRRLGVAPGDAMVFEDSAAGLQAGRRAGARCFAVGRAARTPALYRLAERAVDDLAQAPVIGSAEASRRRTGTGAAG
ncbi:HAD family hydrolase [Streptomyces cinerochromogenes]|uniref:HAD family hydrolase n=1 Tax=Streptomyces cinerochromogenes TaxID=66422 RepID=UPI0033B113D9